MKGEKISINEKENWGGLYHPEIHDAAIGARFADNRKRDFGIFGDRMTFIGEKSVVEKLRKWLFKPATIKKIKANTSFSFYGTTDRNCWATMVKLGNLAVTLDVMCSGEYCYVKAYADVMTDGPVNLVPSVDENEEKCWNVLVKDRPGDFPSVYSETREEAMGKLLDYLANELSGKDNIR